MIIDLCNHMLATLRCLFALADSCFSFSHSTFGCFVLGFHSRYFEFGGIGSKVQLARWCQLDPFRHSRFHSSVPTSSYAHHLSRCRANYFTRMDENAGCRGRKLDAKVAVDEILSVRCHQLLLWCHHRYIHLWRYPSTHIRH